MSSFSCLCWFVIYFRTVDLYQLCPPLVAQVAPAMGLVAFSIWGLGPTTRLIRKNIFKVFLDILILASHRFLSIQHWFYSLSIFNVLRGPFFCMCSSLACDFIYLLAFCLILLSRLGMYMQRSDKKWDESRTFNIMASYMRPILLWIGIILICRYCCSNDLGESFFNWLNFYGSVGIQH